MVDEVQLSGQVHHLGQRREEELVNALESRKRHSIPGKVVHALFSCVHLGLCPAHLLCNQ